MIANPFPRTPLVILTGLCLAGMALNGATSHAASPDALLAPANLVAWCIVPFDASRRGPAARAAMVHELGLTAVAYDWREEHVPSFEAEIEAYRRHQLGFFAFWSWHPQLPDLVRKHNIRPQIWLTNPSPREGNQMAKVREAVRRLSPTVQKAAALALPVGLYNHGGWGGEAANLMEVCRALRRAHPSAKVGIVYNFHHAHDEIARFAELIGKLRPYLYCVNLNGMADAADVAKDPGRFKILPLGTGKHERAMLRALLASGYSGPIGILDHRPQLDARESLRENLRGLSTLRSELASEAKQVQPAPVPDGE